MEGTKQYEIGNKLLIIIIINSLRRDDCARLGIGDID